MEWLRKIPQNSYALILSDGSRLWISGPNKIDAFNKFDIAIRDSYSYKDLIEGRDYTRGHNKQVRR
jgi:hypothetical protein